MSENESKPQSQVAGQSDIKGNFKGHGGVAPAGEEVAHPGRGGQNVYIENAPHQSHPRGEGSVIMKLSEKEPEHTGIKGNFKGHGSVAPIGEPVAHPGRAGQNLFIEDQPFQNHPRGSGSPSSTTSEPQSANDVGLDATQLSVVAARINEVMSNQDSLKQPAAEI